MSTFSLQALKRALRVEHDADDTLLQELLDDAESEALQYLDQTDFPVEDAEDESPPERVPGAIRRAVFLLVSSFYEEADAAKLADYRKRAEMMLFPFRTKLGV
ncbi:MAG TPA: hypothetical protein DCZ11_02995 [Gammaproteobacteria bacterium]|nr:hypothetical protein [Gammaproteobacteria bacterium]MCH77392.1 hypothetical protein [Gammaproteobacteria bacterium]